VADEELQDVERSDAEARARDVVARELTDYASQRVASYSRLQLKTLLAKDILMFAVRDVRTPDEFVEEAFAAWSSSSEEGVMGTTKQRILTLLAEGAIDLGDLVRQEGDVLWVVEIKSSENTITGTYKLDAIRHLSERVTQLSAPRATRRRTVRGVLGVFRGADADEDVFVESLNFTYRHMRGRPFWRWFTGYPGLNSLVGDIGGIGITIRTARADALIRLKREMSAWLAQYGAEPTLQEVMRLVDERLLPKPPRRHRARQAPPGDP